MKFGIEFVPEEKRIGKVVDYVVLAEEQEFSNVWITDHYNNHNTYITLAAIALKTNTIKLGPGVTNPYLIHPACTASALASLADLSGDRAILGMGAGDKMTLEALGVRWSKPLTTVIDAVTLIRSFLTGKRVKNYDGKVYKISSAKINIVDKKNPPNIPFYIGAQGPKMLAAAATHGEGVLINASHPKDFDVAMKSIEKGLADSGQTGKDLDVAAYVSFSVHEKESKARKEAKIVVAFIVAGCPPPILERHGINIDEAKKIGSLISAGLGKNWDELMNSVTDQMIDAFCVAGTPDSCIKRINDLAEKGVSQFVIGSPIGKDKKEAIKLIGTDIIPSFQ
ncbi:MAG: 5,10-methylenetetrahydromethanopterin reductase [Candidatus Hodarchaeales archaeon]